MKKSGWARIVVSFDRTGTAVCEVAVIVSSPLASFNFSRFLFLLVVAFGALNAVHTLPTSLHVFSLHEGPHPLPSVAPLFVRVRSLKYFCHLSPATNSVIALHLVVFLVFFCSVLSPSCIFFLLTAGKTLLRCGSAVLPHSDFCRRAAADRPATRTKRSLIPSERSYQRR